MLDVHTLVKLLRLVGQTHRDIRWRVELRYRVRDRVRCKDNECDILW